MLAWYLRPYSTQDFCIHQYLRWFSWTIKAGTDEIKQLILQEVTNIDNAKQAGPKEPDRTKYFKIEISVSGIDTITSYKTANADCA